MKLVPLVPLNPVLMGVSSCFDGVAVWLGNGRNLTMSFKGLNMVQV